MRLKLPERLDDPELESASFEKACARLPFGPALVPILGMARRRLDASSTTLDVFAETAVDDLFVGLASRLHAVAMRVLLAEMKERRPEGLALAWALFGPRPGVGRERLDAYLSELRDGGLAETLRAYPVLARLLATVVDYWVDAVAELAGRIHRDRGALARASGSAETGLARRCVIGLSDPHHRGRSVCHVAFEDGSRWAYKPRSVALEAAFFDLLTWCNAELDDLELRTLIVIDRGDYGWVEWLEQRACDSEVETARLFTRAGMLLAVLHLVGGTDGHSENFVASGGHLCLVDAETLLYPEAMSTAADAATAEVGRTLARSVAGNGMLPMPVPNRVRGPRLDLSAFGAAEAAAQGDRVETQRWAAEATDAIHVARGLEAAPVPLSAAVLDGVPVPPSRFEESVVDGFVRMYRELARRRDDLRAPDGPLAPFRDAVGRVVIRPTAIYQMALDRSLQPERLSRESDRRAVLDALAEPLDRFEALRGARPILGRELAALDRLDVPFFTVSTTSTEIREAPAARFLTRSGWTLLERRLETWGDDDRDAQVELIRTSLAFATRRPASRPVLDEPAPEADLIAIASAIADDLAAAAVRGDDGSAAWLSLAYDGALESFVLRPTSEDLYDGRAGIGLFLAACARVRGDTGHRDVARACLLAAGGIDPDDATPVGGAVGVGSRIYGLVAAGELLDDRELTERAVVLARTLTRERFRDDDRLDVMHGTAGALLALCALYDATGETEVLERLDDGCRHLLGGEEEDGAWPTLDGVPQTGFSHGASGIAYAFDRAARLLGDPELARAGERALRWERRCFDPEAGNWRDLRRDDPDAFMDAWCHGATGIGLARLGLDPAGPSGDLLRADLDAAIRKNRASGVIANDHLCCGNAGRLMLLFEAGLRLGRPRLVAEARARANEVVHAARATGGYAMVDRRPAPRHCWDLFHGVAGIGHTLLRLARPDLVPQPLLWEATPWRGRRRQPTPVGSIPGPASPPLGSMSGPRSTPPGSSDGPAAIRSSPQGST